jgi:4-hydroxybenzoate polyprenyltransferase
MNVPPVLRPIGAGARLSRVRGAGQTGLIFVAAAAVTDRFPASHLPLLYLLAILGHAIGNVVNDIADLSYDSRDENRFLRPLVNGDLSVTGAACFALSLLLAAAACLSVGHWHAWGVAWTLAMMFTLVWGNVYQKRSGPRGAIGMDLIFGMGMASPLLICPALVGTRPTSTSVYLFISLAAEMMLLNAAAGNLKDLTADERAGVNTTALTLGVTGPGIASGRYPRAYVRYCRGLQALMWAAALAALAVSGHSTVVLAVSAAALAVLLVADLATLNRLLLGRRPTRSGGSEPYTSVELIAFLIVVSASGQATWVAAALGSAVVAYALGLLLESFGSPARTLREST